MREIFLALALTWCIIVNKSRGYALRHRARVIKMKALSVEEFANRLTSEQSIALFDVATGGEFVPDPETSALTDDELLSALHSQADL